MPEILTAPSSPLVLACRPVPSAGPSSDCTSSTIVIAVELVQYKTCLFAPFWNDERSQLVKTADRRWARVAGVYPRRRSSSSRRARLHHPCLRVKVAKAQGKDGLVAPLTPTWIRGRAT
ncbi:hypothetical protein N9L68_01740 [bacterium]|nr:hypothetical protein [bacterium]